MLIIMSFTIINLRGVSTKFYFGVMIVKTINMFLDKLDISAWYSSLGKLKTMFEPWTTQYLGIGFVIG